MAWCNEEEFEKDLLAFSETNCSINDEHEPLPVTIAQYRAFKGSDNVQSIYDPVPYENGITYTRGRGRKAEIYRPGMPTYGSTNDDAEIKRRLKEINSELHSNANIEAVLRLNCKPENTDFCDVPGLSSIENRLSPLSTHSSSPVGEIEKTQPLPPLSQIRQHAKKNFQKQEPIPYAQVAKGKK